MASVATLLTSRHGGVSLAPFSSCNLGLHVGDDPALVVENRRRVLSEFDSTLDDLVVADQVHGAAVTVVDRASRGRGARDLASAIPRTDALICDQPGIVIAILVADCAPVAIIDDEAGRVGLAHAGWRGVAASVLEATTARLVELGSRVETLRVEVGPSIGVDRFEVGEEVVEQLGLSPSSKWVHRSGEKPHIDLSGVVVDRLMAVGVRREHIDVHPQRTGRDYFSARSGPMTGRFAILAKILDNGA